MAAKPETLDVRLAIQPTAHLAALQSSRIHQLRGHCISCIAANISLPSSAVIGYCPLAHIEFTRSKKFMPVRIFCPSVDATPPPLDGRSSATAHWNVGAFDKLPYDWQHHVVNAAPHLALGLPVVNLALRSGGGSVSILHTGMLHHPSIVADFPRPPRVPEVNLLDFRQSGRFSFAFHHFVLGFAVGGLHDWYPREAYAPFSAASHALASSAASSAAPPSFASSSSSTLTDPFAAANHRPHRRPMVAWLSRPSGLGAARALQGETEAATAARRVLCDLGYEMRIVRADAPLISSEFAHFRGVIGVHGGAFANVHACRPGAVVIEMQSERPQSARAGATPLSARCSTCDTTPTSPRDSRQTI